MKKGILTLVAAFMASTAAQAADTNSASGVVSPNAQYSYAETAECINSIFTLNNVSPKSGKIATAMLGRLPACEVEKIINVMGIKRVNELNEHRKKNK